MECIFIFPHFELLKHFPSSSSFSSSPSFPQPPFKFDYVLKMQLLIGSSRINEMN